MFARHYFSEKASVVHLHDKLISENIDPSMALSDLRNMSMLGQVTPLPLVRELFRSAARQYSTVPCLDSDLKWQTSENVLYYANNLLDVAKVSCVPVAHREVYLDSFKEQHMKVIPNQMVKSAISNAKSLEELAIVLDYALIYCRHEISAIHSLISKRRLFKCDYFAYQTYKVQYNHSVILHLVI